METFPRKLAAAQITSKNYNSRRTGLSEKGKLNVAAKIRFVVGSISENKFYDWFGTTYFYILSFVANYFLDSVTSSAISDAKQSFAVLTQKVNICFPTQIADEYM